jgi:hypothetical protein
MNIVLYKDNTLPLDMEQLCAVLNNLCNSVTFKAGITKFHIKTSQINNPRTYKQFNVDIEKEIKCYDAAIFATNVQYDNNYFFDEYENKIIISFFSWHRLTDLPITNGFIYFIASLLSDFIHLGHSHSTNT